MNSEEVQWRQAIPGELINPSEVHVWRVFLGLATLRIETLQGILSPDELARAGRFHFERDQKRFIVARGILRMILGQYLRKDPGKLRFDYTSHGKPLLATNPGDDGYCFNLSHSDDIALYAVCRGRNIGIDIERICNDVGVGQIARRFFSQGEISSLDKIHKSRRSETFFQYWTRKEAFLKATGDGISFPMEHCDVSLINERVLSPIKFLGDNRENLGWYGRDLFPCHGYAAAIVAEGNDWDLSCWDYSV